MKSGAASRKSSRRLRWGCRPKRPAALASASGVAELIPIDAEPEGDGIVKALERALERARAGDFSSVAIVWVKRDGSTGNSRSALPNHATMIGALHLAIRDFEED